MTRLEEIARILDPHAFEDKREWRIAAALTTARKIEKLFEGDPPAGAGLSSPTEPAGSLGPSGFDPYREGGKR